VKLFYTAVLVKMFGVGQPRNNRAMYFLELDGGSSCATRTVIFQNFIRSDK